MCRFATALSQAEELEILFELNWRLETAVIPIWDILIPAYEHVLGAINPFPQEITELPLATLILSDGTAHVRNWSLVRKQWLSLAFGGYGITARKERSSSSKPCTAALVAFLSISETTGPSGAMSDVCLPSANWTTNPQFGRCVNGPQKRSTYSGRYARPQYWRKLGELSKLWSCVAALGETPRGVVGHS